MSEQPATSERPTTVFRTPKTKGSGARYVTIDNAVVQDPRLSFRARGVLAFVLSKPTTWEHSAESLAAASTEGVEAIRSALRELERFGFAEFKKLRIEGGRFKSVRLFRELPDRDLPDSVKPDSVKPDSVKPTSGLAEPGLAEPAQSRLSERTDPETTVSEKTEINKTAKEGTTPLGVPVGNASGIVSASKCSASKKWVSLVREHPQLAKAWGHYLTYWNLQTSKDGDIIRIRIALIVRALSAGMPLEDVVYALWVCDYGGGVIVKHCKNFLREDAGRFEAIPT